MGKLHRLLLASTMMLLPLTGYSQDNQPNNKETGMIKVTMDTNKGVIKLELDSVKAPLTVANFVEYAKSGFYENTIFHRVIPAFMIQGGGFTIETTQKPTRPSIKNEADNGLQNVKGTIAMARTNDPNSATAQFFINTADNHFLDHKSPTPQGWGYAVFGKVTEGMDTVENIEKVKTGNNSGMADVPLKEVIIRKVTIEE
jgi:cyclophilin family peptidyl-prolyl cis-trans isomerase